MTRRPPSSPTTDALGLAPGPWGPTSACTSTSSVRRPCRAGRTTPPGTPAAGRRAGAGPGSSTRLRPWSPISNSPSSPVGPNRCLTASSEPQRVVPVALEAQHGVDHVLEGPRPGQGPVLGHVADQHDGHLAGLGQADQLVGALAHLGELPGTRWPAARPAWPGRRPPPGSSRRPPGRASDSTHRVDHRADVGGRQDQEAGRDRARAARPAGGPGGPTPRPRPAGPVAGRGHGRPAPGAAASTCRCRARRRAGSPSPGPGRRRAPGRARLRRRSGPGGRIGQVHRRPRGTGARRTGRARPTARDQRCRARLLDQGVPLAAHGHAPGPPSGRRPAVDAAVARGTSFGMPAMAGTTCRRTGGDAGPVRTRPACTRTPRRRVDALGRLRTEASVGRRVGAGQLHRRGLDALDGREGQLLLAGRPGGGCDPSTS